MISSPSGKPLKFLPKDHPVQAINAELLRRLRAAQDNLLDRHFDSPRDLCDQACRDCGVDPRLCEPLGDEPLFPFADSPRADLVQQLQSFAAGLGLPLETATEVVPVVAERIQLIRAFEDPDAVVDSVRRKVREVTDGFPREASQIERGKNPGDLLDPFLIAATQELMYGGDVYGAIEATASHKAMMMIEGLVGHLHEDVIGLMRGNVRVPEPRGVSQTALHPETNPFPGADVMQPPCNRKTSLRFHQVKSKMGSAKGGDAKRLGEQLQLLADIYQAQTFYDALIGKSLTGHRSMGGVLQAAPGAVVLVGQSAFHALTGSPVGAELLLRVYQSAFRHVAHETGYSIKEIAGTIAAEFLERAEAEGDDFLQVILRDVTEGAAADQDSRTYARRVRRPRRS